MNHTIDRNVYISTNKGIDEGMIPKNKDINPRIQPIIVPNRERRMDGK